MCEPDPVMLAAPSGGSRARVSARLRGSWGPGASRSALPRRRAEEKASRSVLHTRHGMRLIQ